MDKEFERANQPEFAPITGDSPPAAESGASAPPDLVDQETTTNEIAPEMPSSVEGAGQSPTATSDQPVEDTERADSENSGTSMPLIVAGVTGAELTPPTPNERSRGYQLPLPTDPGGDVSVPSDPLDRIFGPATSSNQRPRTFPPAMSPREPQGDRERVVPSIMVTVMLGHSRGMFDQAVEAAIQRATQAFHKIAKQEIELFAFEQRAARRAADYRLRGPNPY